MDEIKKKILEMLDGKPIIHHLDGGYLITTEKFYQDKSGLIQILGTAKDSVLRKIIYSDEKQLKKMLLSVEIELLKSQIKEMENEQ